MTVYVDSLQVWPHARGKYRAGSCHMVADTVAELHEFAAMCGFKRSWYHSGAAFPHYDLTEPTRQIAVDAGAREVSGVDIVRIMRGARESGAIKPRRKRKRTTSG